MSKQTTKKIETRMLLFLGKLDNLRYVERRTKINGRIAEYSYKREFIEELLIEANNLIDHINKEGKHE
jgi:hypothetical protein